MKQIPAFFLLFPIFFSACKKFIEVGPPKNLISSTTVYESDASAVAVMRGIYSQMVNNGSGFASGGASSVTYKCSLSGDELDNYTNDAGYIAWYTNALTASNFPPVLWSDPYQFINNANAVIEAMPNSPALSAGIRTELLGEAKFVRAFCYFYLVNLFGDVPLITSTNYTVNALASRSSKALVYKQVTADLNDAIQLLTEDYSYSNGERDQPNKWAATALMARTALFTGDWSGAELYAGNIIAHPELFSLSTDLNSVFLANSAETIWQLKPEGATFNTNEGSLFILQDAPSFAALDSGFLETFESGDLRKRNWTDSITTNNKTYYFPFKYKIKTSTTLTEYSMVLRLAEQYLIRAEARAELNNISGSQEDLNNIRQRAGLPATTANDKASLLTAILKERRSELFTEWGQRWLDLKRTGAVDSVMRLAAGRKGGSWKSTQQLYPIPRTDINNDANLKQNPGY